MVMKIGSRGSKLALTQTQQTVKALQEANPGLETEIVVIKTKGDLVLDKPLNEIGDKGLFVREIEEALLRGDIDLAVHSLKDMPARQPQGLEMNYAPKRQDPRDVFVSFTRARSLNEVKKGATVATGSLRRIAQIKALRPDMKVVGIRGNVETRIRKAAEAGYDGVILAAAGLNRLGLDFEGFYFTTEEMIPAATQGILGLETRSDDQTVKALLAPINDEESRRQAQAEREFLRYCEGGCHAPMGCYCQIEGENFRLNAFFQTEKAMIRETSCGTYGEEAAKGRELALKIKERMQYEG